MWPFDIFKKKKEKKEQEQRRLHEEERRQKLENEHLAKEREKRLEENRRKEAERQARIKAEKEIQENVSTEQIVEKVEEKASKHVISKPNTKVMSENDEVSEYLNYLAGNCNLSFNLGNQDDAIELMNQLFKACYGRNGHKLLQLSSDNTQVVGLAFANIALYLDFNDEDMNSVAAENALYCLGRNIIENDNTFCAPSIFTMLFKRPALLKDKLIAAHASVSQKRVGMPIGLMLGGNPFNAPHLEEFREQATTEKRIGIMRYLLSLFYDTASDKFTIPTDLPYNLPSNKNIEDFIILKKNNIEYDDNSLLEEGQDYFYEIFSECQDTLKKMI